MALDTHAAFRQLENSGFDTKQAEALVQVINGATGEQATKEDIKEVREDFKEFREEVKVALKEQGDRLEAALKEQDDRVLAALDKQDDRVLAALDKQSKDFKERFATKYDVAVAVNRTLLGNLAIAALLFAALQLFS